MTDEEAKIWVETKRGQQVTYWIALTLGFAILLTFRWVFGYEIAVLFAFAIIGLRLAQIKIYVKELRERASTQKSPP